eukprot:COSAG03_NODE_1116_length_4783_cov_17.686593_6_plen_79_part_00
MQVAAEQKAKVKARSSARRLDIEASDYTDKLSAHFPRNLATQLTQRHLGEAPARDKDATEVENPTYTGETETETETKL